MGEQFSAAKQVLKKLEQAGYEAYLVGGCVRDHLLGKEPTDYDVTTNALPSEVQKVFSHTIPTGLKHGTISIIQDHFIIEVTTYRVEGRYQDHRRPDVVNFVSQLEEDLLRRDFTINAMAMDRNGKIIDYINGQKDLAAKKICTVGKAEKRFQEDALRMLRACRFAAQLSFQIDDSTLHAISRCSPFALHLAVERIVSEFTKIWKTKKPSTGLVPLMQTKLLSSLPPFHQRTVSYGISEREWNCLDYLCSVTQRWVYFLHLVFREEKNRKQVCIKNLISLLPYFKFSNIVKKSIANLIQIIGKWNPLMTEKEGKTLLLQYNYDVVLKAQTVWQAITEEEQEVSLLKWWDEMPIKQFTQLAIKGDDLLRVTNIPAGPWLKETLHYLYHQVAFGYIPNDAEVLEKEGEKYGAGLTS